MNRGYIKAFRRLFASDLWLSEKFTRGQAWLDLIGLANHADGHIRVRGIRVEVRRGCVGWSEMALAARWGWSRGKVRRFLSELEAKTVQQIEQQKSRLTTLIRIVNYDLYQSDGKQTGQQTGQQTDNRRDNKRDTNNNEKHEKHEKNDEQLTPLCPPAGGDLPAKKPPPKKKTPVPESFDLTDAMVAWAKSEGANGNLRSVTDCFLDHHRAKGSLFIDWQAAWRTWVRNEVKFSRQAKGLPPDPQPIKQQSIEDMLA